METVSNASAAPNIQAAIDEGRIITGNWRKSDAAGRELVCLLAAISPDIDSEFNCPAELMPSWMASATVILFDGAGAENIQILAPRYARAIAVWGELAEAEWTAALIGHFSTCLGVSRNCFLRLSKCKGKIEEYDEYVENAHGWLEDITGGEFAAATLALVQLVQLTNDAEEVSNADCKAKRDLCRDLMIGLLDDIEERAKKAA